MIKIGDFSKLSMVSIKTLRYYDEMGLLKPVNADQFTGYRYYSASQLPRLNRILALKDLGFSLEQIAQVLNEGVSLEQLRGMLRLKRAELQQHISNEQERLTRIEARLNEMTMEGCQQLTNICSSVILLLCLMHERCITELCDRLRNLNRRSARVCGNSAPATG